MLKTILEAIKALIAQIKNQDAVIIAKDAEIAQLKTERDEAVALANEIKAELEALVGGFTPSGN